VGIVRVLGPRTRRPLCQGAQELREDPFVRVFAKVAPRVLDPADSAKLSYPTRGGQI
jgi:hypothetical protein